MPGCIVMIAKTPSLLALFVLSAGCSLTIELQPRAESVSPRPQASSDARRDPVKLALPPRRDATRFAQPAASSSRRPEQVLVARGPSSALAVVYADGIAVSTDDGQRWRARPLPAGFAARTAAIDEAGAVYWTDTALRVLDYDASEPRTLRDRCTNARFALWSSTIALRCAAERSDEDIFERSEDGGRTWRSAPAPPMSHHTDRLEFDSRGNLQQTWSWSAGCGGGGGGRSWLARNDASWKELPTPLQWDTAQIGAGGWSYNVDAQRDHHYDRSVIVARQSGEDRVIAYLAARSWRGSSFNGTVAALLIDDAIVLLDGPSVFPVIRAPEHVTSVTLDARQRVLATTDRAVLRWSDAAGWHTLDAAISLP